MTTTPSLAPVLPIAPDQSPAGELFSEAELAQRFNVCERTIQRMRLPFVKIGRVRYYVWTRVLEELSRRAQ